MKGSMDDRHIPSSYEDLFRTEAAFIRSTILRINPGGAGTYEDVFQHISLKIIESDVLGKFQRMVASRAPLTMTAEEACQRLGIKFAQWRSRQYAFRFGVKKAGMEKPWKAKWAPEPVDGEGKVKGGHEGYAGRGTRYLTLDVERLAEEKGFRRLHFTPAVSTGPVISAAQWRGYLKTAIHNHWANYCRTSSRRHKERVADRFPELRQRSEGGEVEYNLERVHWGEDDIEARVDLKRITTRAGTAQTAKGEGFLDLVGQGYTGMEALEKLDVKVSGRLRVTLRG